MSTKCNLLFDGISDKLAQACAETAHSMRVVFSPTRQASTEELISALLAISIMAGLLAITLFLPQRAAFLRRKASLSEAPPPDPSGG